MTAEPLTEEFFGTSRPRRYVPSNAEASWMKDTFYEYVAWQETQHHSSTRTARGTVRI